MFRLTICSRRKSTKVSDVTEPGIILWVIIPSNIRTGRIENF